MVDETDRRAQRIASIDKPFNGSEACHIMCCESDKYPDTMLMVLRPNGVEHLHPIVQLPEGDPDLHRRGYTPIERFTAFGRHCAYLPRLCASDSASAPVNIGIVPDELGPDN